MTDRITVLNNIEDLSRAINAIKNENRSLKAELIGTLTSYAINVKGQPMEKEIKSRIEELKNTKIYS